MEVTPNPDEHVESLHLTNSQSTELTFWLEPWGHDFSIPPGDTFEVVFHKPPPPGGHIVIEVKNEHLIIYGWGNSGVTVFHNGNEIVTYFCSLC